MEARRKRRAKSHKPDGGRLLTEKELPKYGNKVKVSEYNSFKTIFIVISRAQDAKTASILKAQEQKGVERIITWMSGKCTQHWANSTPFRWKCLECWQALKKKELKWN